MWSMMVVFCIVGVPCGEVLVKPPYETKLACEEAMAEALMGAHIALDIAMAQNEISHGMAHRVGGKCVKNKEA